jgi:hypothetical protein
LVVSWQGGRDPWRDETQERIGSHRRLTTVDRSTDFRIGLKPLETRPTPPTHSRVLPRTCSSELADGRHVATWERIELGRSPCVRRRQERQEGHGVPKGVPAVGRENL